MFLLREKTRQVDAATGLIADELDGIARLVERQEGGTDIHWLMDALHFDVYEQQAPIAFAYGKRHPALWKEVRDVYAEMRNVKATGANPIASGAIRDLAGRLRGTKY